MAISIPTIITVVIYTEECHILETDVEINQVYPHTYKLQCGPLIDYVDIKSYRDAVKAYQDSLRNEG